MGGMNTGELYSQEDVDRMSQFEKDRAGIVPITPSEAQVLSPMSTEQRKQWFRDNKSKKPTRKQLNKRERQNRKAGRK